MTLLMAFPLLPKTMITMTTNASEAVRRSDNNQLNMAGKGEYWCECEGKGKGKS